jgi:S1-C subfamily serine protease
MKLNPALLPEAITAAVDELTRDRSAMSLEAANREVYLLLTWTLLVLTAAAVQLPAQVPDWATLRPVSSSDTNAAAKTNVSDFGVISTPRPQSARQVAQNSFPSVVLLVMEDANGQPIALGSGFFVRENVIASNFHVIEGASSGYAKLIGQKTKYDITGLAGVDTMHDLVLLNVTGAMSPSLPLADSRQAAVGDEVFAVGNPQGLEGTFSQGIVSSIRDVESSGRSV